MTNKTAGIDGKHKYYAFISYKREDEKWAKWLQNRLMRYKLPVSIRRTNPSLPATIHPIFRDTTDLSGGVLASAINQALDDSRYLIVICSPRAAQSPWVCKEVEHFIDAGREQYIIPFIVEGEPNSEDIAKECFPMALRRLAGERELLGININDVGRDAAAIKVVARMFELQFDTLYQRWERDRRRRHIAVTVFFITVFLSLCLTAYFLWQNRVLTNMNRELDEANIQLEHANTNLDRSNAELARTNAELSESNNKLDAQKKELEVANKELDEAYNLLESQKSSIERANVELEAANRGMYINRLRYVAKASMQLTNEGRQVDAAQLALEILPKDLDNPDKPFVIEAEAALRKATPCTMKIFDGKKLYNSISISCDERYIALLGDKNIVNVYDIDDGRCVRCYDEHSDKVNVLKFNPRDGEYLLSASDDKTIKLWSTESDTSIRTYRGHKGSINTLSFSPDGRHFISGSNDKTIKLWSIDSEMPIRTYDKCDGSVSQVVFAPGGEYFASVSTDVVQLWSVIQLWSVNSEVSIKTIPIPDWVKISAIAITPDDKYICIGGDDGVIYRYSIEDDSEFTEFTPFLDCGESIINIIPVNQTVIDSNQYVRVALASGSVLLVDMDNDENCYYEYILHGEISSYTCTDSYTAMSSLSGDVFLIFDLTDGSVCTKTLEDVDITSLAVPSNDYTNILFNDVMGSCIRQCDISDGGSAGPIVNFKCTSHNLSSNGKYAVTMINNYDLRLWSVENVNEPLASITASPSKFGAILFVFCSNDGRYLAATNTLGKIIVWDLHRDSKQPSMIFQDDENGVNDIGFSYDGRYMISSSLAFEIKMWDLSGESEDPIKIIKDDASVWSAQFSPDDRYIVSGSISGAIKVWDVETEVELDVINSNNIISAVAFTPDGRHIVSASCDENKSFFDLKVWEFKPLQQLIDDTREIYKNNPLTPEVRAKYYLE